MIKIFGKLKKFLRNSNKDVEDANAYCRNCGNELSFDFIEKKDNIILETLQTELFYSFCDNCRRINIFTTEFFFKQIHVYMKSKIQSGIDG